MEMLLIQRNYKMEIKETFKTLKNSGETRVDVAVEKSPTVRTTLNQVGMEDVELPILLEDENGLVVKTPAKCELLISLDDPHAKGIHMSRLYLTAKKFLDSNVLDFKVLEEVAKAFLDSHIELSYSAKVKVAFDLMQKRPSLKSNLEGWRFYPLALSVAFDRSKNIQKAVEAILELKLTYSSTCPCSAALAQELNIEDFQKSFNSKDTLNYESVLNWLKETNMAVPHVQRSEATVKIKFKTIPEKNNFKVWINKLENSLGTPVQAAVKREDEQAFAQLNADNHMFSEDACRKLKASLEAEDSIEDYYIKVEHYESLHPHNAVAISTKGISGGFQA